MSKILEYRNIESLRIVNETSERHMSFLKDLTVQLRNDSNISAQVARRTHKDAKGVKALSTVATVFLPASLIATIFSSNLVQIKRDEGPGSKTQLELVTQFWVYIVSTMGLTIVTLGCTWFLERQWVKSLFP
ncbi:hypothetical protein P154DRAFT_528197 [Amniculicola lignicola CBS 123094]|uniref:Cora-domain-containing protein n=1 Tax=Amniculicola lignicola CBS 123094 TaxID=1392246 RepID=A0A6A5VVE9_9PLEO|nr:hypothetical protein P154DRAFT_528197 [Amniculicola lignicola CBS 123094]